MGGKKGQADIPIYDYRHGQNGKKYEGKVQSHVQLYMVDGKGGMTKLSHPPKMGEHHLHGGAYTHNQSGSAIKYH